jgi:hypothetical protein
MSIQFAGIPLLLGDAEGQFQSWLDRNLPLEDVRMFGTEPPATKCTRNQPRSGERSHVGLALPNWPAAPRPKINTLWWPVTGASRWAVGYFLASTAQINQIAYATGADNSGILTLSIGSQTISGTMYSLAPRMLSGVEENGIWLLPLVDQRYFWQFLDCGELKVTLEDADTANWTSWSDVVDQIQQQLSTTISMPTVATDYKYPDPVELTRQYENLAVLFDSVAESIGMRVVAQGDDISLMNVAESASAITANLANKSNLLAGGESPDLEAMMPEKIQVVFPTAINWKLHVKGDVYAIAKQGSYSNMPTGTKKTLFSSAPANYGGSYIDTTSTPQNESVLQALALQIATDYCGWRTHIYDRTYIGLKSWAASGYDDYVWYHIGYQYPKRPSESEDDDIEQAQCNPGNYACYTRITSLPYDFGVVDLLHGLGSLTEREWYNHDATECPIYGVGAVTGVKTMGSGKIIAQVDRPTATAKKDYVVNSDYHVTTTSTGEYQNDGELVRAQYDTGTPAIGEVWIPKASQWTLTKGSAGAAWGIVVTGIHDSTNKILLGRVQSSPSLTPFKLTSNLNLTTHEATANPGVWDASGNGGAGTLTPDTETTVTVRDTTEVRSLLIGDVVFCDSKTSDNGPVWEIVVAIPCGPRRIVLTADYVPGDGTMTGYFYDDPAKTSGTFYTYGSGYGIGRGGGGTVLVDGTFAWAEYVYNPDIPGYGWSVVDGDFTTVMNAHGYDTIADNATGLVELWWQDPNTADTLIASGKKPTVLNVSGREVKSGDKIFVVWSRSEGLWTIPAGGASAQLREIVLTQNYIPVPFIVTVQSPGNVYGYYADDDNETEHEFGHSMALGIGRIGNHAWVDPQETSATETPGGYNIPATAAGRVLFGEFESHAIGVVSGGNVADGQHGVVELWWPTDAPHIAPIGTNALVGSGIEIFHVLNSTGSLVKNGDRVQFIWNESLITWQMVGGGSAGANVKWASVYTVEHGAASSIHTVYVKTCDPDGTNVAGDAFSVYTPEGNGIVDLQVGQVVGYVRDEDGRDVIVTHCYWDDTQGDGTWTEAEWDADNHQNTIKHIADAVDPDDVKDTLGPPTLELTDGEAGAKKIILHAKGLKRDTNNHILAEADEAETPSSVQIAMLDEKGKVDSGDSTPGYLDSKLVSDGTWISKETLNVAGVKQLKVKHDGPGESYGDAIPGTAVGVAGATLTVTPKLIHVDEMGHVVSAEAGTGVSFAIASGDDWIGVAGADGTVTITHGDPGEAAGTAVDPVGTPSILTNENGTKSLRIPVTGITFDAKGHQVGAAAQAANHDVVLATLDEKVATENGDTPGYLGAKLEGDGTWISTAIDGVAGKVKISHAGNPDSGPAYRPVSTLDITDNQLRLLRNCRFLDGNGHLGNEDSEYTGTPLTVNLIEMHLVTKDSTLSVSGGYLTLTTKKYHVLAVDDETAGTSITGQEAGQC